MDARSALDPLARDASVAVFDVRRHRGKEQLRGAVFYRYDHFEGAADLALPIAHGQIVLVYADDDDAAARAVAKLHGFGFERAPSNRRRIEGARRRRRATGRNDAGAAAARGRRRHSVALVHGESRAVRNPQPPICRARRRCRV